MHRGCLQRLTHIFRGIKNLMFKKIDRKGMWLWLICVNEQHVSGVELRNVDVMDVNSVVGIEVKSGSQLD